MTVDLAAIRQRYSRALDAKPGKGEISPDGIVAITDSVCDIPELLAELDRLARWKAEALPVLDGLQELGTALGLRPGTRITGPEALAAVEALNEEIRRLRSGSRCPECNATAWGELADLRRELTQTQMELADARRERDIAILHEGELQADADTLAARTAEAIALHRPHEHSDGWDPAMSDGCFIVHGGSCAKTGLCRECGSTHPCPTARTLQPMGAPR